MESIRGFCITNRPVLYNVFSGFSGEGKTDPTPFADQLKESGVKILTLAFVRNNEGEEEVQKISNLASPGFAFRSDRDQSTLAHRIQQAFCQGRRDPGLKAFQSSFGKQHRAVRTENAFDLV